LTKKSLRPFSKSKLELDSNSKEILPSVNYKFMRGSIVI